MTDLDILLKAVGAVVLLLLLVWVVRHVMAIRQTVSQFVFAGAASVVLGVLTYHVALANGLLPLDSTGVGIGVGLLVFAAGSRRSRHVPSRIRHKIEAEWEARTGKKINRRKKHLDHRVPFALGGGHTEDNLRIIDKGKNLRKGKKLPGLFDWG